MRFPSLYEVAMKQEVGVEFVRTALRAACEAEGTQIAFADRHDLSTAYVNDVLKGRREPGESILRALGFERVVRYRRTRQDDLAEKDSA